MSLRVNDEGTERMQTREEYPTGVPCFVDTGRKNPVAAMDFYARLFGWEFTDVSPNGAPSYFSARLHGLTVGGIGEQPGMDWAPAWNTYVRVDSADETADKVAAAGGKQLMGPFDVGPAGRMAAFTDPEGATISVWEPGETRGAQLVNQPGSWVSSELLTHDPDGAAAFYGEVFGWETAPLGDMTMFVRAGYGDELMKADPGLREQLAKYNAPERFEDQVAYLVPASEDQGGPSWGVTFAVADADESTRRASELGGQVLVEPTDAPWVRMSVITDPDGAALTLSQFVPPEG